MMRLFTMLRTILFLLASGLLAVASAAGFKITEKKNSVDVTVDGKAFATYVLDQANKPYLYPV